MFWITPTGERARKVSGSPSGKSKARAAVSLKVPVIVDLKTGGMSQRWFMWAWNGISGFTHVYGQDDDRL